MKSEEEMKSSVFDQLTNLPLYIKKQEIQLKDFALVVAKFCLTIEHHKQFKLLTEISDYKDIKMLLSEIFPSKQKKTK